MKIMKKNYIKGNYKGNQLMSIWTFRRCSSLPIVLTEFSFKYCCPGKHKENLTRKIRMKNYKGKLSIENKLSMKCNEKYPGKVPETIFDLCSMDLIICRSALPTIYGSNFHT